ncbi:hypothetical protein [Isoptericola variabilis]|nr:hypothetical protein [Isoptericola variabilis]
MTVRTHHVPGRRARAGALLATGVLVLAGCTGQADDPSAAATPSATPSVATGSPVPDDGPLDRDQACAAMYVDGGTPLERRVGDALLDVSESFDTAAAAEMHDLARDLGRLQERVPDEFGAALDQVRVPFVQMQEHLDTGGDGSVDLDVASAVDGLKQYRELCS